jgi:hypothetical protein
VKSPAELMPTIALFVPVVAELVPGVTPFVPGIAELVPVLAVLELLLVLVPPHVAPDVPVLSVIGSFFDSSSIGRDVALRP